jgi:hypothetical protein
MTSDRFEEIIYQISCLAMKDSEVVGEIPLTIINTDSGAEVFIAFCCYNGHY